MHGILISQHEQRANASSLSTLASNFDCESNHRLKNAGIVFRYFAENILKHASRPSRRVNSRLTSWRHEGSSHDERVMNELSDLRCLSGFCFLFCRQRNQQSFDNNVEHRNKEEVEDGGEQHAANDRGSD
jgi:hypothetical protein